MPASIRSPLLPTADGDHAALMNDPQKLLRLPGLLAFTIARFSSSIADQFVGVAVGWQMYALTHSTFSLGLIGLVQFLPRMLLTPVVGHVADHYPRHRLLAVCMALETLTAVALAATSATGLATPVALYVMMGVMNIARAFESPTMPTLLPALVGRESLVRATAMIMSVTEVATVTGPALGGVLYVLGPGWVYGLAAAFTALGMVNLLRLQLNAAAYTRKAGASWKTAFDGFRFIMARRVLFGTLSLDLFAVFLGGAVALMPVFARDILHAGPWALGLLRAAPAVGAIAMALLLARLDIGKRAGTALFSALAVFGLATLIFGLSHWIALSVASLVVLGAADTISVVVRSALVQLNTPNEMLGRVSAINSLFVTTSNQMGAFRAGTMAAWIGAAPAVVVGGVGVLVVTGIWMWRFPEMRRLKSLSDTTVQ